LADVNQHLSLGDNMRDGGKGDRRRKLVVPEEQFNAQWDLIFKKKPVKTYTGDKPHPVADEPKEQND